MQGLAGEQARRANPAEPVRGDGLQAMNSACQTSSPASTARRHSSRLQCAAVGQQESAYGRDSEALPGAGRTRGRHAAVAGEVAAGRGDTGGRVMQGGHRGDIVDGHRPAQGTQLTRERAEQSRVAAGEVVAFEGEHRVDRLTEHRRQHRAGVVRADEGRMPNARAGKVHHPILRRLILGNPL